MAIGIGMHCWYCEHGPCNGECKTEEKQPPRTVESLLKEALAIETSKKESKISVDKSGRETRPWGSFQVIRDEENFKAKILEINPGGRLSKQYHFHREETWVIASGIALVLVGSSTSTMMPGDVVKIGKREIHRVENPGDELLVIMELQQGDYFGEDDIVRIEDDYDRK
jgi:mannose-6-phosphate isomerase